ncbi:hypothetical protein KA005_73970, partial [bacterium]|nr:hypothetical protein [bacterium]
YHVQSSRTDVQYALFTADLIDLGGGDYKPQFTRGGSWTSADGVSYAVIEFVGSNWADIQRLDISTTAPEWTPSNYDVYKDVSIVSESGSDLSDFSRAFIHQQYRTSHDPCGLDDAGVNIEIVNNTHLRIRNRENSGAMNKVVWIIENLQSSGKPMSVKHGWFYKGTGGSEELSWTQSINSVISVNSTSIFAQASCDGAGDYFPRGSIDYRLTSTNEITFTESDTGQEIIISYDVVQWPSIDGNGVDLKFEVGELVLSDTIDQSISAHLNFQNNYNQPVVIAYISSRANGESVEVRVKDVDSSGCVLFMEEPDNGAHPYAETIGYIVMESGEFEFPDGTIVKAGTYATDIHHYKGGTSAVGVTIAFSEPFATTPVVLHSLNTYNNGAFKSSIAQSVSTSSFLLAQETAETGTT